MKKLLAALLAVLCLAGCSAKPEPTEMIGVTVVTTDETPIAEENPTVEEVPMEEETVEEAPKEEVAVEDPAPELTEEAPEGAIDTYAMAEIMVEGLVDDAIGYAIVQPEFAGFPGETAVNDFYAKLVTQLETYTKETVHAECLERHCMANVFGKVLSTNLTSDCLGLEVAYEFKVEYSDGTEPKVSVRTDVFDVQTGEQFES